MRYLARYVFKVAIAESRIKSVDDTHVSFTYRKVHSQRVRTMRLPVFAFLHRFLQHVLPSGFMKVRYFGFSSGITSSGREPSLKFRFLSPNFHMPLEEIKARIELAQGFNVRPPAPIEVKPPQRLRCPRCGATLSYRCTVLPRAPVPARIQSLVPRTLSNTTMHTLNSGP